MPLTGMQKARQGSQEYLRNGQRRYHIVKLSWDHKIRQFSFVLCSKSSDIFHYFRVHTAGFLHRHIRSWYHSDVISFPPLKIKPSIIIIMMRITVTSHTHAHVPKTPYLLIFRRLPRSKLDSVKLPRDLCHMSSVLKSDSHGMRRDTRLDKYSHLTAKSTAHVGNA